MPRHPKNVLYQGRGCPAFGDLARKQGEMDRAIRAWEFAMTQFEGIEDAASCKALQERFDQAD